MSIALVADGLHSFADAVVSLIVWIGLRLARKAPDGRFHFGYYRIETFSSVLAAFFMTILGGVILYESYQAMLAPREIVNPEFAMAVAVASAGVALAISFYKNRAAKKYGSLALKTDALNSVKDVLTSVAAFAGIAFNRYFGVLQADSFAGVVIALFVFTVAYFTVREASLVLVDACQCTEILADIGTIARRVPQVKEVHSIRMRKMGPYLVGDMHVVVDGEMTVREADEIAVRIEEQLKEEFDEITEIKIRIEPQEQASTNRKRRRS